MGLESAVYKMAVCRSRLNIKSASFSLGICESDDVCLSNVSFRLVCFSISKFEERCCFLYVLHNSDDFQIYFCTELHCKRHVFVVVCETGCFHGIAAFK